MSDPLAIVWVYLVSGYFHCLDLSLVNGFRIPQATLRVLAKLDVFFPLFSWQKFSNWWANCFLQNTELYFVTLSCTLSKETNFCPLIKKPTSICKMRPTLIYRNQVTLIKYMFFLDFLVNSRFLIGKLSVLFTPHFQPKYLSTFGGFWLGNATKKSNHSIIAQKSNTLKLTWWQPTIKSSK